MVFSRIIPNLFTPGIVTSSHCVVDPNKLDVSLRVCSVSPALTNDAVRTEYLYT